MRLFRDMDVSKSVAKMTFVVASALVGAFDFAYLIYLAVTAFKVLGGTAFFDSAFRATSVAAIIASGAFVFGIALYFVVKAFVHTIQNKRQRKQ